MKNGLAIVILAAMLSCSGRAGQSLLEKAEESPDKLARLEAVEYYKERGTADEASFRQALYTALDIFRSRQSYDFARSNPLRKVYRNKRDDSDKLKLD